MSKRLTCRSAALAVLLVAALLAAVPRDFVPDWTFQGSDLKGFQVVGEAGWRAEKGEIIGTPKSAGGGWLIFEKSLQDVAFFVSFRCAGTCKSGVLFRTEKTASGMKGVYVSLTEGDLAAYRVTLNAQGQELSRETLRRPEGYGHGRFALRPPYETDGRPFKTPPPPVAGAGAGGRSGQAAQPGPVIEPQQWHTLQVTLDADMLRPALSLARSSANAGRRGGSISGGGTDDMEGFGPIALYVGGSAEVRFKDISYKDLVPLREPKEVISSHFQMQRISDFYYSWCTDVADINRDGIPDIVSPPFYYLGPDFTERHEFLPAHTFDVSWQFTDHMIAFARDFTGDGWPDIVTTYTNGTPLYLYVNPRGESRRWKKYEVIPSFGGEIGVMYDVDADGAPDVVYADRQRGIVFASPDRGNPTGPWKITEISGSRSGFSGHGIGVGDINGDARLDILAPSGWWEQPPKGTPPAPWKFHAASFGRGSGEMSVYDINGDGLNDVITPLTAHEWGISWFEQKRDSGGNISFVEHPIMGDLTSKNVGGVVFSQPHASITADLDGDGIPDFIVGKRHNSHTENYADPDPHGPAVLYWYRTVRKPKAPGGAEFVPELIHNRSGVGSHLVAANLNGDGAPDIITSVTRGTFVFYNGLRPSTAKLASKKK